MSTHGSGNSSYSREAPPVSQYLHDRLNQHRAKSTRPKHARHTDFGPQRGRDDDIFLIEAEAGRDARPFDSSPITAIAKTSRAGSDSRRRALGIRDMDEQFDRLSKQNFALKLELDHRRDQTVKLQEQIEAMRAQVERADTLEDEHKELLKINSQMVEELEQRDKAVEEAMDIICDLEDRVAYLESKQSNTRPSTANPDSGYAGTENMDQELPSPPRQISAQRKTSHANARRPSVEISAASQKLQGLLAQSTPAKSRREPAALSAKKPSTNALRSVYLASSKELHPVKSFQSMLSRQGLKAEDDAEDVLNSPRLSTLSESSFPSIYEPQGPQVSPERYDWEDGHSNVGVASARGSRSHLRQDSMNRVSQWIEEGDVEHFTPSKSNSISTPLAAEFDQRTVTPIARDSDQTQYRSMNDALTAATVQSMTPTASNGLPKTVEARLTKQCLLTRQPRPNSFAGPIFGEPLLPPTPDSASTHMLRASNSSMSEGRNLFPADAAPPNAGLPPVLPPREGGVRTAPRLMRSSVELSTAFQSNLQYRNANLDGSRAEGAYDASDADCEYYAERIRDFGIEYQGYPDGGSIVMGTPSRFLRHARPPVGDIMFNSADSSPPQRTRPPPRRRRSSDNHVGSPSKRRLDRAETSPVIVGTSAKAGSGGGQMSAESMFSPHSAHSGSSGERTIVQAEQQRSRARSPLASPSSSRMASSIISPVRSRMSPSPGRTLSQRTAGLFRRLSASNGDREVSPLPTLTSTPSSAYANSTPIELRRPKTSHADRSPPNSAAATIPRPPSSHETRRPSLQLRTKTEPATARPPSSAAERTNQANDKRGLFRRSNSVKKNAETGTDAHTRGSTKRRGSIRDAVSTAAGRRPWRG
ncbi:hypothetical protein CLAFUW4_06119 [Fulvia fulva]|uniref:Centrosomin N-terminal motif 1 domain-containing protein n=1 Tax=Passalora fulva TaxID=5499 RepID=A0A9Q8LK14_PASFU|nr:uncharacterized protein CLAFUR5_06263 [Fulvia fulva]KAK4624640.1 hypothetical protein CLAFUR4_06123 [Fulvia fulva]KAK4625074.1 hypothetical protein CLAFUR0_06127 [Fulvia fulva]UJO18128.1 hypothetical protein CLAFUR5_06263 [Fulvia fulva]WPV14779.1 hypothetical protein CLAFUW4_06119 [Fulvia fulva]WPV30197.1 hypothetical protein CLAFUW7_06116 [Fulvia fulva]